MSVASHGNNWAGESAYVDAGVLSPVGRPKVVATTAKIPMLVAGADQAKAHVV